MTPPRSPSSPSTPCTSREEPPFRRFVLPALALCSGLFMVIAGILSYQWDCLYYLLFFAVFMAAGALFYKRKSL